MPPVVGTSIGSFKNKKHIYSNESIFQQQHVDEYRKCLDSNEFNYWFECSSFSSGQIKFDLVLDKGEPEEQKKFLRKHDKKTKWLYFVWDEDQSGDVTTNKLCGCVGGCYFYSVFVEKESIVKHKFFDMNTSIARLNPNFADSLFYPGTRILDSQDMMKNKYEYEFYTHKYAEYELLTQKKSLNGQVTRVEMFEFDDEAKKDATLAENSILSSYSPKNSSLSSLSTSSSSSIVSVISKNESVKIRSSASINNDDNYATLKPIKNNSALSLNCMLSILFLIIKKFILRSKFLGLLCQYFDWLSRNIAYHTVDEYNISEKRIVFS